MASPLTYPGVYIEEIPSGVRTISGVSTSITAFVGRALRGPLDEPLTLFNYGDYEREFGGLWDGSTMSYAVRDFFNNGGGQAVVVRLYQPTPTSPPGATKALIKLDTSYSPPGTTLITLEAIHEGSWGNKLTAAVSYTVLPASTDHFNLTITDGNTGRSETFYRVSLFAADERRLDKVLERESKLMRSVAGFTGVANRPAEHPSIVVSTTVDDGVKLEETDFIGGTLKNDKKGLYALKKADLFNLLCIPPFSNATDGDLTKDLLDEASDFCFKNRAFLIVDPRAEWDEWAEPLNGTTTAEAMIGGTYKKSAAVFFPRILRRNLAKVMEPFAPCGMVAGTMARTDATRGVWKAPAGMEASLLGVERLTVPLTDDENGALNQRAINCIRTMPVAGPVLWGARTMEGDDRTPGDWKYIPVRRTALFIEESLFRGTKWAVFEPNDEPLWGQLRLNIGAFMHNLFRQGAFQGQTAKEAYFVKCDRETTTQNDINLGTVNIVVGFAPLKPAEFVVIKLQQIAGQIAA